MSANVAAAAFASATRKARDGMTTLRAGPPSTGAPNTGVACTGVVRTGVTRTGVSGETRIPLSIGRYIPDVHTPIREIAALFLRLGATAFGGPAAHIAMMEDEVVRRRGWMSREEFLDLVAASNLIPGPNSTELAIHVGYARGRWPGLLVAGACFILPAVAIVWGVAWAYAAYGSLPAVGAVLAGIKPVVLAVIAQALWGLGRTALVSAMTLAIGVLAIVGLLMGMNEVLVLAIAGALAWLDWRLTRGGNLWERGAALAVPLTTPSLGAPVGHGAVGTLGLATASLALATATVSLGKIFLAFAKAGALLFGSGYVLIAFLRADFVTRTGWLTESQLLDAIAVGQFTPGPLFTTATFVGYQLAGHAGAAVATAGIFLPAFLFVALTAPLLHRLRDLPSARAALGGLNVASLALMAVATASLARDAFARPSMSVPLFAVALLALVRWRVNSAWLVLGGALVGWFVGLREVT